MLGDKGMLCLMGETSSYVDQTLTSLTASNSGTKGSQAISGSYSRPHIARLSKSTSLIQGLTTIDSSDVSSAKEMYSTTLLHMRLNPPLAPVSKPRFST